MQLSHAPSTFFSDDCEQIMALNLFWSYRKSWFTDCKTEGFGKMLWELPLDAIDTKIKSLKKSEALLKLI